MRTYLQLSPSRMCKRLFTAASRRVNPATMLSPSSTARGSQWVVRAGACWGNCKFPSAQRVACTGCTQGFIHFRCLATLPTAVANAAGQRRLCAACAQAVVKTEAPGNTRTTPPPASSRVPKRVKRVRPPTPSRGRHCQRAMPSTTPAGYSRAGMPTTLDLWTLDWHPNTGASTCGASNDPGERVSFVV